jgi:hypothetical protein
MRFAVLFILFTVVVHSYRLNCYHIVTTIQSHDILLYPETEKRLHSLCPSVSAHIVSGMNESYDGVVESLLNRVDGSPIDTCYNNSYEDKLLRKINLSCRDFSSD